MSLRTRLAIVLALGLSALVVAALVVMQILEGTEAARERAADEQAETTAQALAEAVPARADTASIARDPDPDLRRRLRQIAVSVLKPIDGGVGGYCSPRAGIVASSSRERADTARDGGGPSRIHPLSGELESAVTSLCSIASNKTGTRARVEHARDVEIVYAQPLKDGAVAWALVRVRAQETPAFAVTTVVLAVAALLLVLVTVEAMIALGRGVATLRGAVVGLAENLGAPVPKPRARELADVARGLETMASRLVVARERERELAQSLSLEQRLAGLGRVAAGVAHEVRNPLAGMKLRLDLLKREASLSKGAREDVAACLDEVARLDRLVESLLSVGRAKSKPVVAIDLAALADARVASAAVTASKKRLRLERVGGATVSSEPDAVTSAIENLLRNAIDASPDGGKIVVRIDPQGGEGATLDVEDRGPGIPADREPELFEPFFTTKPDGTGLGLWVSRLLLEARGARLRYDRERDVTRMRIQFPKPGSTWRPS